jgi:hypothetical protein
MAETKIGFVSGGKQSMPHYASFTPLVSRPKLPFDGRTR